jgi:hypothetical protein
MKVRSQKKDACDEKKNESCQGFIQTRVTYKDKRKWTMRKILYPRFRMGRIDMIHKIVSDVAARIPHRTHANDNAVSLVSLKSKKLVHESERFRNRHTRVLSERESRVSNIGGYDSKLRAHTRPPACIHTRMHSTRAVIRWR